MVSSPFVNHRFHQKIMNKTNPLFLPLLSSFLLSSVAFIIDDHHRGLRPLFAPTHGQHWSPSYRQVGRDLTLQEFEVLAMANKSSLIFIINHQQNDPKKSPSLIVLAMKDCLLAMAKAIAKKFKILFFNFLNFFNSDGF